MDKSRPPEAFGVFKPAGHTVIVFRCADDLAAAQAAFIAQGFQGASMVRYAADEMLAQVDVELQNAGVLASFGYELDLVEAHRVQAQNGCSFLVIHAPDDATAQRVSGIVKTTNAIAAQHYGTFMIEELLEPTPGGATTA